MAGLKTKDQMLRIVKLTHDTCPKTFRVERRQFGLVAFVEWVVSGTIWLESVEVDTLEEAKYWVDMEYNSYKKYFGYKIIDREQVWP